MANFPKSYTLTTPPPPSSSTVMTDSGPYVVNEVESALNRFSQQEQSHDPLLSTVRALSSIILDLSGEVKQLRLELSEERAKYDRMAQSYHQAVSMNAVLSGVPAKLIPNIDEEDVEAAKRAASAAVEAAKEKGELDE